MDALPSPDLIEVVIKGIERLGVPTVVIIVGAWLFSRYQRKVATEPAAEPKGWQTKVEADLKALRQQMDAQDLIWRQRFDTHHDKLIIIEARLAPLFNVFDRRLAELLHQPHPEAYDVDRLLEKYQVNPESLTDGELNRLISHIFQRYERIKSSTSPEDQAKALAATMYLAILDGQRAIRDMLKERNAREDVARQQRAALRESVHAAKELPLPAFRSWWSRLKQWWSQF